MQFRKLYLFLCRGYLIIFFFGASYVYAVNNTTSVSEIAKQIVVPSLPQSEMLNINEASAEEIAAKMQGVGLKKAKAIVDYRTEYGKFVILEQLMDVSGIGEAIFQKNKDILTL